MIADIKFLADLIKKKKCLKCIDINTFSIFFQKFVYSVAA